MRADTFAVTAALVVLAGTTAVSVVRADCPSARATLLTFNTGLVPTVPDYDDRRANIFTNVKAQFNSADFVCLQEVWYENDVKALVDKLESDFPFHFSAIHSSVGELRNSRRKKFLDFWLPGRNTVPCGVRELTQLTSDISTVWRMCADKTDKFNRINRPGLLVLSKLPLDTAEYVNFWEGTKVLLERGYINVKVTGVNPNYLCTHLSAFFPLYFEQNFPQFSSYTEQQVEEIEKLRNFPVSQSVILGDFNTGPARSEGGLPELDAELPENYRLLTEDFVNPYLDNGGACTFCPSENPLSTGTKELAIDFVLTKNVPSDVTSAQRVLDRVDILLSDHFGVKMDICLP